MENKYLFEVETAWPFPIIQYSANTSYVEVRKASGIAYILLQLIHNSDNHSKKLLVDAWKSLGVPKDIHYIFAGELANMISHEIIRIKSGRDFRTDFIDTYVVADFEITDLGKKLFAEGTIPTGNNKVKKIQVYYNVSKKDTLAKCGLKLFCFENSVLDQNCIGKVFLNDSDVECFINENMARYGFRKGERISGIEHQQPEVFVYKMDNAVTIRFTAEKLQICAKDKDYDEFIQKNYSLDIIAKIINAKKKYQFSDEVASEIIEYDYSAVTNVVKIYLPSQFTTITGIKNQLSLAAKCEMKNSECVIGKNESADIFEKCNMLGAACYFKNGNLYGIVPGRFMVEVEGYAQKCAINMIVVQLLGEETRQQIMREVFLKCLQTEDTFSRCNVIKKLTEISKSEDYVEQFAICELKKKEACNDRIEIFLKLNDEFSKVKEWKKYSRDKSEELFQELCEQVTITNFAAHNVLGKKINNILGLSEMDYLSRIIKKLVSEHGSITAFEAMEGLGYGTDKVLSVVNIFETYCQQILDGEYINGNSKLSGQCALLGRALFELQELTGIKNPYEDSANLDFDNERFIQVMATFADSRKKLEKYKTYALEQYKMFDALYDRYTEIKEVVTIEKEASKKPSNINKSYIEQRLKKSRYKDAICDLHIRLQYELNRLFHTENRTTNDLLHDKKIKDYLSEDEVHTMHSLRICRNGFQHPNKKREVRYSEQIIRDWCDIIEKLGGMSNESCSKN